MTSQEAWRTVISEPFAFLRIPRPLRALLLRQAALEGVTAATMLARLLDEHDRRLRFEAGWSAYAADAQAAPSGDWDVTLADGLEREDD